jgi:glycosyltransferase involved in cell wall biosynthesis
MSERKGPRRAFVVLSRTTRAALSPEHLTKLREAWDGEVELLDRSSGESRLRGIARLVRKAGRYDAVVLDGSAGARKGYMDQVAAAIIGRRPRGPEIVFADCQWQRGRNWLDRLACWTGIRIVDTDHVIYCVLSAEEVGIFPRTWGVGPDRVSFTPWPYVLRDEELADVPEGEGVFAGGDSLRDYGPLVAAAGAVPGEITIATRQSDLGDGDRPANLRIVAVSHGEFVELMRKAAVVVVPLVPTRERSAGQTTYVNAMALGKLVVVTDCLGVRSYVRDRETGLVVPPGDAHALADALRWAVDPANRAEVGEIRARAREIARSRLDPDEYVANLLRIAGRRVSAR